MGRLIICAVRQRFLAATKEASSRLVCMSSHTLRAVGVASAGSAELRQWSVHMQLLCGMFLALRTSM